MRHQRFVFLIQACLLSVACFSARSTAHAGLSVSNHEDGSTVRYPVVLLRGDGVPEPGEKPSTAIEVENLSSQRATRKMNGQAHGGKFKILTELIPGDNHLKILAGDEHLDFSLHYKPQTNPHYVRIVWMTDKSGDTTYAAPNDDDPQDYAARLDTGAKLMQCFTAERMQESGYGRRTFRLELDSEGKVIVHTLAAPQGAADYYAMKDGDWWNEVRRWLNREHSDPLAKNMVLAAFTRKDPETGKMLAHTALGGGNLGLFGSASVFSWPSSLDQVDDAFLDDRPVDPARVHDDSAGRHTYWGTASTTLGATLHEMGHCFGLPHCRERFGIMTRGFDYLNRAFTFHEPPSRRRLQPFIFEPGQEATFAAVSASYLRWSRWFQLDAPPATAPEATSAPKPAAPKIAFDPETERFSIASPAPIRWIGFWRDDTLAAHREIPDSVPLLEMSLSLAECEAELGPQHDLSRLSVMTESGQGVTLRFVETKTDSPH